MSTRSMTVLESPNGVRINLYRRCDGYPAYAGATLAKALAFDGERIYAPSAAEVATKLLAETHEGFGGAPRPDYELADWGPDDQGDLEHVYLAKRTESQLGGIPEGCVWKVSHFERAGWDSKSDSYLAWPVQTYALKDFAAFCAREQAEMQKRMEAFHAAHGKAVPQ